MRSNARSAPVLIARGLDGYFDTHHFRWPTCGFQASAGERSVSQPIGGDSEGDTPLPIPNREVKPLSADGTWPARAWESRSPPIIHRRAVPRGGPSSFPSRLARMSVLAIVLVAVGVLAVLFFVGGLVVARRRLDRDDFTD